MSLKINFGKRLKFLREGRQLSQAELAELVGLDAVTISRIETGEHFVKAETIDNLKEALGVNYEDLFKFDNVELPDKRLKNIIIHLKRLNDNALDYFLDSVKAYTKRHTD